MEKHERNRVGGWRHETRAEQRYTIAVRALHWFYFFSSNFGGEDGRSCGKFHFQERLRLILNGELYFGEGLPFRSDKGRDGGAFSDGGEHAGVWEARPFQSQRRGFRGLAVIAKRRLQRITRKSAQIGIHFLDVQAFDATGFLAGQFESALPFHQDFTGFALRVLENQDWRSGVGIIERAFERDQKLVSGCAVAGDFEK